LPEDGITRDTQYREGSRPSGCSDRAGRRADRYLSGPSARGYFDEPMFAAAA